MTPAHSLKTTRSSHSAQYRRHQTYSDALKNSFSPELFHIGMVCLLLWQMPSPQRSLGHSLFKQKFSQRFFVFLLCCFVFLCFLFFYFIKISKFALPGVMLMYERTSKERKKESRRCCRTYEFIPTDTIPHLIFCHIPLQNLNLCWFKYLR